MGVKGQVHNWRERLGLPIALDVSERTGQDDSCTGISASFSNSGVQNYLVDVYLLPSCSSQLPTALENF